jgi:hypothetical protein
MITIAANMMIADMEKELTVCPRSVAAGLVPIPWRKRRPAFGGILGSAAATAALGDGREDSVIAIVGGLTPSLTGAQ